MRPIMHIGPARNENADLGREPTRKTGNRRRGPPPKNLEGEIRVVTSAPGGWDHHPRAMAKRKKSEAPASPSKGGVPARPRRLPALRSNWLLPAWKAALARLQAIDPSAAGLEDELQQETDPVTRARLLAERMAPLDLKTGIAITHVPAAHHGRRPAAALDRGAQGGGGAGARSLRPDAGVPDAVERAGRAEPGAAPGRHHRGARDTPPRDRPRSSVGGRAAAGLTTPLLRFGLGCCDGPAPLDLLGRARRLVTSDRGVRNPPRDTPPRRSARCGSEVHRLVGAREVSARRQAHHPPTTHAEQKSGVGGGPREGEGEAGPLPGAPRGRGTTRGPHGGTVHGSPGSLARRILQHRNGLRRRHVSCPVRHAELRGQRRAQGLPITAVD
jgi:hypothetical protein